MSDETKTITLADGSLFEYNIVITIKDMYSYWHSFPFNHIADWVHDGYKVNWDRSGACGYGNYQVKHIGIRKVAVVRGDSLVYVRLNPLEDRFKRIRDSYNELVALAIDETKLTAHADESE